MGKTKNARLIKGGIHIDNRGQISFVNDFKFDSIERFYIICNSSEQPLRAWQGHKIDNKFFYCAHGKVRIHFVKIDNWDSPSRDLKVESVILTTSESNILHIPEGYANGIEFIDENSKILCFTTLPLTNVHDDAVRYPSDYWSINE